MVSFLDKESLSISTICILQVNTVQSKVQIRPCCVYFNDSGGTCVRAWSYNRLEKFLLKFKKEVKTAVMRQLGGGKRKLHKSDQLQR